MHSVDLLICWGGTCNCWMCSLLLQSKFRFTGCLGACSTSNATGEICLLPGLICDTDRWECGKLLGILGTGGGLGSTHCAPGPGFTAQPLPGCSTCSDKENMGMSGIIRNSILKILGYNPQKGVSSSIAHLCSLISDTWQIFQILKD